MTKLLQLAFVADPIACFAAGMAIAISLIGVLFRRGGGDARFIIEIFGAFATLGTVLKMILWVGAVLTSTSATPPGGTDLVLALGALFAIMLVSMQGLTSSLSGPERRLSMLGELLAGSAIIDRLPVSWRLKLGLRGREIQGILPGSGEEGAPASDNPPHRADTSD